MIWQNWCTAPWCELGTSDYQSAWEVQKWPLLPLIFIKKYKDIRFDPMIESNVMFPNSTNRKEMLGIARQTFMQCELDSPLKPQSWSVAKIEKVRHPLDPVLHAKLSLHILSRPQDMLFSSPGGSAPLLCWEPDLRAVEYLYRQYGRFDVDSRCVDVVASVLRKALISATNRIARVNAIKNRVPKHSSAKAMFVFTMSTSLVQFYLISFLQIEFRAIVRRFKMKSVNLVVSLIMANELALQHHRLFSVLKMSLLNTLYHDELNDAFWQHFVLYIIIFFPLPHLVWPRDVDILVSSIISNLLFGRMRCILDLILMSSVYFVEGACPREHPAWIIRWSR